jgi:hypothetical protein
MVVRSETASRLGVFVVLSFAAHFVFASLGCGRTRLAGAKASPSQEKDSGIARDTRSGLDASIDVFLVRDAFREASLPADAATISDVPAASDIVAVRDTQSVPDTAFDVVMRDAPQEPSATVDAEIIPDVPGQNDSAAFHDTQYGPDAAIDVVTRDVPQELLASADAETTFDVPEANDDSGLNNMCSANAPVAPPESPAHGTFAGPNVDILVCDGGVHGYLFVPTGSTSPYIESFDDNLTVASSARFSIRQPQNVESVDFLALFGVSSLNPGTYTSAQTCGSVGLCLSFPIPAGLDCSTDAGFDCPPGCQLVGPSFALTCMPVQPTTCYIAQGSSDCVFDTQPPMGAWQLTLTSIALFSKATGYVTHGSLTATMVNDQDATDTFSLSLEF